MGCSGRGLHPVPAFFLAVPSEMLLTRGPYLAHAGQQLEAGDLVVTAQPEFCVVICRDGKLDGPWAAGGGGEAG